MDNSVPLATPIEMRIAQVALDLPLETNFDFLSGDLTHHDIGRLVVVPFGNRQRVGIITGIAHSTLVPAEKLKSVIHIQRDIAALTENDFALFRFCQHYYHHPLGPIALNAIPPALRSTRPLSPKADRIISITSMGRDALEHLPARSIAQRKLLSRLLAGPCNETVLGEICKGAATVLRALDEKHWVTLRTDTAHKTESHEFVAGPVLNDEQRAIVTRVSATLDSFSPFLLSGITGSGKTEVYLHLIAAALQRGMQALVLVPEINLTPQFLRQIASRFPLSCIVQQHSGLAKMPRMKGYLDAQTGIADIVIGTRLSVFTPLPRLGLVVIDEEHDASFKQQEGFRYSARDVAVFRAQMLKCPIVLGSATPSLESFYNAQRGRFTALSLTRRANPNAALPKIGFIDISIERTQHGLSASLVNAIAANTARGEQTLLFINRRGYAPALVCTQCGWMPHCRRCSARLVFHQKDQQLKCHHCNFQSRVATVCADCGSLELIPAGQGTERVEATLREKLPQARIARVDRDSTARRGSAEKIFAAAAAGELDVLVGTQMLAKGHDFPRITLVGVVNADNAMFSADFRASERMVAQLMQVAGRAGRANLPGTVLIQTRFANHPLYQAVAQQDHARFAHIALAERKQANLPPYHFLALLRAESQTREALMAFLEAALALAKSMLPASGLQVWDPVPAPLSRKAGFERQQLMVQATSRSAMQKFLTAWLPAVQQQEVRGVRWMIDVDPLDV